MTSLALSVANFPSAELKQQTGQDVRTMLQPLENILRNTGAQQKKLTQHIARVSQENQQQAQRIVSLEAEVQRLRIAVQRRGQQTAPVAAPVQETPVPSAQPQPQPSGYSQPLAPVVKAEQGDDGDGPVLLFSPGKKVLIHDMPVHSVAMDPNATKRGQAVFASASWDATVKFYDLSSEKVVKTFGGKDGEKIGNNQEAMQGIYSVAFAKTDPNVFGCSSCDWNIYLWNSDTGQYLNTLKGHKDEVNDIDFHPTQQVMCSASDDCSAIIWDFQEGKELRNLDKHTKAVYGATFLSADNQYFCATCCFDQKARVWDIRDKQMVAMVQLHSDDIIGIDYSSQQRFLATGSDDGLIGIWDARTWRKHTEINTRSLVAENEVKRVAWSPCGYYLAAACSSRQVLVYRCDRQSSDQPPLVATLAGHDDCVFDVAWGTSPGTGKSILVSACHDKTSQYWMEL